jgi:hypothetical protein
VEKSLFVGAGAARTLPLLSLLAGLTLLALTLLALTALALLALAAVTLAALALLFSLTLLALAGLALLARRTIHIVVSHGNFLKVDGGPPSWLKPVCGGFVPCCGARFAKAII